MCGNLSALLPRRQRKLPSSLDPYPFPFNAHTPSRLGIAGERERERERESGVAGRRGGEGRGDINKHQLEGGSSCYYFLSLFYCLVLAVHRLHNPFLLNPSSERERERERENVHIVKQNKTKNNTKQPLGPSPEATTNAPK